MQALRRSVGRVAGRLSRAAAAESSAASCSGVEASQAARGWRWQQRCGGARAYASEPLSARGPVSYLSLGMTLGMGGGLFWWYQHEKEEKMKSLTSKAVVVGSASIGGPFDLIDDKGKRFTDKDLLGKFSLLYFGFCYCPDVCPEEMEKISAAVDLAEKETGVQVLPVYITIDPERDGVKEVAEYVKEFHPRMIGLTGPLDKIKDAAKAYRVYFNKTGESEDDYLVDHSIITYLLDPEGRFVTFYGKNFTAEEMSRSLGQYVRSWKAKHPEFK